MLISVFLIMEHIQGISRNQLQLASIEDKISSDNLVRCINVFVSLIEIEN